VRVANAPAIEGLLPDKVVLLDLPPNVALQRAKARAALDRIEAEALSFHEAVRRGFLEEAEADSDRFCVILAEGSPEDIHGRILDGLEALL
jgi:dTMP kinase